MRSNHVAMAMAVSVGLGCLGFGMDGLASTLPAAPVSPVELHLASSNDVSTNTPQGLRAVATGGTLLVRWNEPLLREAGLGDVHAAGTDVVATQLGFELAFDGASRIEIAGDRIAIFAITGGRGRIDGGFDFSGGATALSWQSPTFVVRPGDAPRIDFVSDDGRVLFYADKLMYEWLDGGDRLQMRSADLNISAELAAQLGKDWTGDTQIAELRWVSDVTERSGTPAPASPGNPNFHGESVPGVPGAIYQADVFMQTFTATYQGCQGCDGSGGANDGQIKFVPSSTLINNRADGAAIATVANDPLGTSDALYSADVSWYEKFTTSSFAYPYPGNDQHPYLIWNLYRLNADGGIVQIGRSGVKHAFLTTNQGGSCDNSNGGHILGRSCVDTYGTGNNDNARDLGPRSEIVPATGEFGRCRSIFDPDCNGQENTPSLGQFDRRMLVRESAVDASVNAGASWLFESWYIVQDDINIYNTMATRPFTSSPNGSAWSATNGTPYLLGPAIDRWQAAALPAAQKRNREIVNSNGHTKVAVKAIDLGNGTWRYHYAVHNLDFGRPVYGSTAPPNLEVIRNLGFGAFEVPVAADSITSIGFADGDDSSANNWQGQQVGGRIVWTAPAGNTLNWGSLYSFTFVANARPYEVRVQLGIAEPGAPSSEETLSLAPDRDGLFGNGFD